MDDRSTRIEYQLFVLNIVYALYACIRTILSNGLWLKMAYQYLYTRYVCVRIYKLCQNRFILWLFCSIEIVNVRLHLISAPCKYSGTHLSTSGNIAKYVRTSQYTLMLFSETKRNIIKSFHWKSVFLDAVRLWSLVAVRWIRTLCAYAWLESLFLFILKVFFLAMK